MSEFTFTYSAYESLLDTLDSRGYAWTDHETTPSEGEIILRHDVDYSPRKARRLAEIEHERDVTSTYFFLLTAPYYNIFDPDVREIIETIESLGHDVQLHFSTHAYWDEQPENGELLDVVDTERKTLETVVQSPITTVAFHNPPSWVVERTFDPFVSTYEPRFFEDITYIADSDQRWRKEQPLSDTLPERLQLLVHPVLWDEHDGWVTERLRAERDYITNRIERNMEAQNRIWSGTRGLERE